MALTRLELRNMAIRLGKVQASNSTATGGLNDDFNVAIQIIGGKKRWTQLLTTNTLSLTGDDGDTTYALDSTVDEVIQMRISSPTSYARVIPEVTYERHFEMIPDKTLAGETTPNYWYFAPYTIGSNNVATKNVSFSYRPDQAYTITYLYKQYAPNMDSDTDYPFFDGTYHHILVYYALWKYAERTADPSLNPVYWRGEWENALEQMLGDEQYDSQYAIPIPGVC